VGNGGYVVGRRSEKAATESQRHRGGEKLEKADTRKQKKKEKEKEKEKEKDLTQRALRSRRLA